MPNYDLPILLAELERGFKTEVRKVEKTDDVDADFINPMFRQIFLNDKYLAEKVKSLFAKIEELIVVIPRGESIELQNRKKGHFYLKITDTTTTGTTTATNVRVSPNMGVRLLDEI